MRTSWLIKLSRGLAVLLVTALVLIAVSMSLLRLAVAYAPQLRGEVERVLTQALERPLTLGGMRATWAGRHPRLVLEDVRLTGGPLAGLEVPELEVDVDLLRSLQTMQLRLAQVAVSGLEVRAAYEVDGALRITKIGNANIFEDALSDEQGPRRLPARIQLRNTSVQLVDIPADTTYRLNLADLDLSGRGAGYALGGYIPLPYALGHSIRFRAEWQGGQGGEELSGKLYVDARRLRLQSLSALLSRLAPVPAVQGSTNLEFWADLTPRGISQALGRVAVQDVALPEENQQWRTVAGQIKGDFHWQQQPDGWDLAVADMVVASPYRVWPKTQLSLQLRQQEQQHTLELSSGYLHLGDLAAAAAVLPLTPPQLRQWLAATEPTAELLRPQFALSFSGEQMDDFKVYSEFRAASMQPLGHLPGAAGLSGDIRADRTGGRVRIDAGQGELRFTELFHGPLPFHSLRGAAFWRVEGHGWTVEAPLLEVANHDGRGRARLRLVGDGEGLPFIDLRARITNGDAKNIQRYLPVPVLPDSVVEWLAEAGISGRVPQADVALFGRLDDFPFTAGTGLFLVQADFADARLDYRAGWPAVESAEGQLRFVGDSMNIRVDGGRIHGATIAQAEARIEQLGRQPLLVDGQVRGSGQQLLGFLRDSPLGEGLREHLVGMRLSGNPDVSLRLRIPFDSEPKVQVQGSIALNGTTYRVPKWDLALERLHGTVRFTERGVTAERVSGRYRGVPVAMTATTGRQAGREQIRLSGRLHAPPGLLLGQPPPGVTGTTDWDVQLLLPAFQAPLPAGAPLLELEVASRLQGIAVDLPAPLGKSTAERRQLRLSIPIGAEGAERAWLRYGDEVRAQLGFAAGSLDVTRAAVQLGAGQPTLPRRGLVVRGALETIDLNDWQPPAIEARAGAGAAGGLTLQLADVNFGRVRAMGQEFRDTAVQVSPSGSGWSITLSGPDVAGDVLLAAEPDAPLVARLERLRLQPPSGNSAPAQEGGPELPSMDITVGELVLRDQALGRLELQTHTGPRGVQIEQARVSGPLLELSAIGGWDRVASRSHLAATLSSGNVGALIDAFGYAGAMRGGSLQGRLDVAWDGRLRDFSLPALAGPLDFSLRNGQILSVEPGAGRLFGLLSIGDLPRRLSLDFSDLFGKGFAYDRIEAHLQLADGNAYTRQFYMQGPSARVDLDGRIGLASRDYDQRVTVTPNVSTALPAIGAVAAGPIGAVAGFVTQKLLQDEINKLSRYRYRVAGSWDSPEIEPLEPTSAAADRAATDVPLEGGEGIAP